jgi:hypothetical protein
MLLAVALYEFIDILVTNSCHSYERLNIDCQEEAQKSLRDMS